MQGWNLARLTALCLAVAIGLAGAQYLETTIPLSYDLSDMIWNQANDRVYVSNYNRDTVTVIDGATNQVTSALRVASYPIELCLNPTEGKVYCISGESDTLSVIDAVGDTLLRSLRVRGFPIRMVWNALMNKLYVICTDDNMVRVYDGTADTLVAELKFGAGSTPYYLLWHPVTNRVFCVTDSDTVFVIDCNTDLVAARTPAGAGGAICRNAVNNLVYVSSHDAVHILSPTGDSVVAVVSLPPYTTTNMCAVPFPNKVYVARGGWLHVIDGSSHVVSDSIAVRTGSIVCDTDRGKVYGAFEPVCVFDARGDTLLLTIPAAGDNWGPIVWNQFDGRIYVLNKTHDAVLVIRDTTTAVAEPAAEVCQPSKLDATICRGRLRLGGYGPVWLLDLTGRRVAGLKPGNNDVHGLKGGVYFIKSGSGTVARKVVIQN